MGQARIWFFISFSWILRYRFRMTIQGIHIHIENIHKFYLYFILNPIILTLTVEISMSFFAFLLYTFIYFVGLGTLLSAVLGVSPFVCFSIKTNEVFLNPFSDWIFLIHEFQWGLWAVDSGINFVIFLCFILFFPLWILCWFWVRKLRFFRILKKPFYYLLYSQALILHFPCWALT